MITPSIVAENLTKGYGSLTALSNLNLKIEGSKCVGFLGPNGAGKTTTLKIQAVVESLAKIEPWFLITYGLQLSQTYLWIHILRLCRRARLSLHTLAFRKE